MYGVKRLYNEFTTLFPALAINNPDDFIRIRSKIISKENDFDLSNIKLEPAILSANDSSILTSNGIDCKHIIPFSIKLLHTLKTNGHDLVNIELDGIVYPLIYLDRQSIVINFDYFSYERYILNEKYYRAKAPISSRLPFNYSIIPVKLRNYYLRISKLINDIVCRYSQINYFPQWPYEISIDALRLLILNEAAKLSKAPLALVKYPGEKRFAAIITHDVETIDGLKWIETFRKIERKNGVYSAWSIISGKYETDDILLRKLINEGCEIFSHGYIHDGKIPYLTPTQIRWRLSHLFKKKPWLKEHVKGFRSSQLLRSETLSKEVSNLFDYDLSVPDTEKYGVYRLTRGCGTVYPFINTFGTMEIPLTMPQDFFLKEVHLLNGDEILKLWKAKVDYICKIGGVAVFNIHPDPYISGNNTMLNVFEKILEYLIYKNACFLTPNQAFNYFNSLNLKN